jgi:hypothetical protein
MTLFQSALIAIALSCIALTTLNDVLIRFGVFHLIPGAFYISFGVFLLAPSVLWVETASVLNDGRG